MQEPQIPDNEAQRLKVLQLFRILDTEPEQAYDDITYMAAQICQAPIALISLVDSRRQWFKSRIGLEEEQTSRTVSFCAHAINRADEMMIVHNADKDERFKDNPLVCGEPGVKFYAGIPITFDGDIAIGSLCVIDNKPRVLSAEQKNMLEVLSRQLKLMLLRRLESDSILEDKDLIAQKLEEKEAHLESSRKEREILIQEINHRVRNNLQSILGLAQLHIEEMGKDEPDALDGFIRRIMILGKIHEGIYNSALLTDQQFTTYFKKLYTELKQLVPPQCALDFEVNFSNLQLILDDLIPLAIVSSEIYFCALRKSMITESKVDFEMTGEMDEEGMVHIVYKLAFANPELSMKGFEMLPIAKELTQLMSKQMKGSYVREDNDHQTRMDLKFTPRELELFTSNGIQKIE